MVETLSAGMRGQTVSKDRRARELSPAAWALRLAAAYAVVGATWIVFSDRALDALHLPRQVEETVASFKGAGYAVVTSVALYFLAYGMLTRLRTAQQAVHEQDLAIRRAYADVLGVVTGGRLVLVTANELDRVLGSPLTQARIVSEPRELSTARSNIKTAVTGLVAASDLDIMICAVGEALTNALAYGGSAEYQVFARGDAAQVLVRDHGPGIDFATLPKATLSPGFSTGNSLGWGFSVMLEATTRLIIETGAGGTTVVLEFK